jgi:hypothetical protein
MFVENITLEMDDDVIDKVLSYAAEHKTTVDALVQEHLEQLVRETDGNISLQPPAPSVSITDRATPVSEF